MVEKQILERIKNSIQYVENRLTEPIDLSHVAKVAYMSQSAYYMIFSRLFGTTIKDYVRKRRLSSSAFDLINTNLSILDIALKYQYQTYESYSRAFKKLFGIPPRAYRNRKQYMNIFPKIYLTYQEFKGGVLNKMMNKEYVTKKVESISKGYIFSIDIDNFQKLNDTYGYDTGDYVLLEVPKRLKKVLDDNKIDGEVTRLSRDEFVILLNDLPKAHIEEISDKFIDEINQPLSHNDKTFNITISIGITHFSSQHFDEIFKNANDAMIQAKKNGKNQYHIG